MKNPHTSSSSHLHSNVTAHVAHHGRTFSSIKRPQVLLATLHVVLKTPRGEIILRALLDQCAQATFITKKAADALNLPLKKGFVEVRRVGGK